MQEWALNGTGWLRLAIVRPIVDGRCYHCGKCSREVIFGGVDADVSNNVGAELGGYRVVASGKVIKGFLFGTVMILG